MSLNTDNLHELKVVELKEELKARGLGTTGRKAELVDRISRHLATVAQNRSEFEEGEGSDSLSGSDYGDTSDDDEIQKTRHDGIATTSTELDSHISHDSDHPAGSKPAKNVSVLKIDPPELHFDGIEADKDYVQTVCITNMTSSNLDFGLKAGNSNRVTVTPSKVHLGPEKDIVVQVKIRLTAAGVGRAKNISVSGFKDVIHVQSDAFNQHFHVTATSTSIGDSSSTAVMAKGKGKGKPRKPPLHPTRVNVNVPRVAAVKTKVPDTDTDRRERERERAIEIDVDVDDSHSHSNRSDPLTNENENNDDSSSSSTLAALRNENRNLQTELQCMSDELSSARRELASYRPFEDAMRSVGMGVDVDMANMDSPTMSVGERQRLRSAVAAAIQRERSENDVKDRAVLEILQKKDSTIDTLQDTIKKNEEKVHAMQLKFDDMRKKHNTLATSSTQHSLERAEWVAEKSEMESRLHAKAFQVEQRMRETIEKLQSELMVMKNRENSVDGVVKRHIEASKVTERLLREKDATIEEKNKQISQLTVQFEEIQGKQTEYESKISKYEEDSMNMKMAIEQYEREIQTLKKQKSVSEQVMNDSEMNHERKHAEDTNVIQKLNSRLTTLQIQLAEYEEKEKEKEKVKKEADIAMATTTISVSEYQDMECSISNLKNEVNRCMSVADAALLTRDYVIFDRYDEIATIECALNSEVEACNAKCSVLEDALLKITGKEKKDEKEEKEKISYTAEIALLQSKLQSTQQQLKRTNEELTTRTKTAFALASELRALSVGINMREGEGDTDVVSLDGMWSRVGSLPVIPKQPHEDVRVKEKAEERGSSCECHCDVYKLAKKMADIEVNSVRNELEKMKAKSIMVPELQMSMSGNRECENEDEDSDESLLLIEEREAKEEALIERDVAKAHVSHIELRLKQTEAELATLQAEHDRMSHDCSSLRMANENELRKCQYEISDLRTECSEVREENVSLSNALEEKVPPNILLNPIEAVSSDPGMTLQQWTAHLAIQVNELKKTGRASTSTIERLRRDKSELNTEVSRLESQLLLMTKAHNVTKAELSAMIEAEKATRVEFIQSLRLSSEHVSVFRHLQRDVMNVMKSKSNQKEKGKGKEKEIIDTLLRNHEITVNELQSRLHVLLGERAECMMNHNHAGDTQLHNSSRAGLTNALESIKRMRVRNGECEGEGDRSAIISQLCQLILDLDTKYASEHVRANVSEWETAQLVESRKSIERRLAHAELKAQDYCARLEKMMIDSAHMFDTLSRIDAEKDTLYVSRIQCLCDQLNGALNGMMKLNARNQKLEVEARSANVGEGAGDRHILGRLAAAEVSTLSWQLSAKNAENEVHRLQMDILQLKGMKEKEQEKEGESENEGDTISIDNDWMVSIENDHRRCINDISKVKKDVSRVLNELYSDSMLLTSRECECECKCKHDKDLGKESASTSPSTSAMAMATSIDKSRISVLELQLADVKEEAETYKNALHTLQNTFEALDGLDGLVTEEEALRSTTNTRSNSTKNKSKKKKLSQRIVDAHLHESNALTRLRAAVMIEAELRSVLISRDNRINELLSVLDSHSQSAASTSPIHSLSFESDLLKENAKLQAEITHVKTKIANTHTNTHTSDLNMDASKGQSEGEGEGEGKGKGKAKATVLCGGANDLQLHERILILDQMNTRLVKRISDLQASTHTLKTTLKNESSQVSRLYEEVSSEREKNATLQRENDELRIESLKLNKLKMKSDEEEEEEQEREKEKEILDRKVKDQSQQIEQLMNERMEEKEKILVFEKLLSSRDECIRELESKIDAMRIRLQIDSEEKEKEKESGMTELLSQTQTMLDKTTEKTEQRAMEIADVKKDLERSQNDLRCVNQKYTELKILYDDAQSTISRLDEYAKVHESLVAQKKEAMQRADKAESAVKEIERHARAESEVHASTVRILEQRLERSKQRLMNLLSIRDYTNSASTTTAAAVTTADHLHADEGEGGGEGIVASAEKNMMNMNMSTASTASRGGRAKLIGLFDAGARQPSDEGVGEGEGDESGGSALKLKHKHRGKLSYTHSKSKKLMKRMKEKEKEKGRGRNGGKDSVSVSVEEMVKELSRQDAQIVSLKAKLRARSKEGKEQENEKMEGSTKTRESASVSASILQGKITSLTTQLKNVQAQLNEEKETAEYSLERIRYLESELRTAHVNHASIIREKRELSFELKQLQVKLDQLETQNSDFESIVSENAELKEKVKDTQLALKRSVSKAEKTEIEMSEMQNELSQKDRQCDKILTSERKDRASERAKLQERLKRSEADARSKEQIIHDLNSRINGLTNELEREKQSRSSIESKVKEYTSEKMMKDEAMKALRARISTLQKSLDEAKSEADGARSSVEKTKKDLKRREGQLQATQSAMQSLERESSGLRESLVRMEASTMEQSQSSAQTDILLEKNRDKLKELRRVQKQLTASVASLEQSLQAAEKREGLLSEIILQHARELVKRWNENENGNEGESESSLGLGLHQQYQDVTNAVSLLNKDGTIQGLLTLLDALLERMVEMKESAFDKERNELQYDIEKLKDDVQEEKERADEAKRENANIRAEYEVKLMRAETRTDEIDLDFDNLVSTAVNQGIDFDMSLGMGMAGRAAGSTSSVSSSSLAFSRTRNEGLSTLMSDSGADVNVNEADSASLNSRSTDREQVDMSISYM